MNTIAMTNQRPTQKLHPLSLLAQMMSRRVSGCLQVSNGAMSWSLHLDQGKLIYASSAPNTFDRLDQHLRRLSVQVPTLVSAVRVQVRLIFSLTPLETATHQRDYEAICWLVEQQHLTLVQAASLIEDLAKEVLESFLTLQEGSYELLQPDPLAGFPQFCQLELRPLVEYCQNQLRRRQAGGKPNAPAPAAPASVPSPNMTVSSVVERFSRENTPPPLKQEVPATDSAYPQPAASPEVASEALYRPPATPESTEPTPRTTYTIACIDDSLTVLNAIKSFLDDRMFTVLMINSPVQALMQIVRSKPDLILLDVEMPNLDGYELCSLLRRHPSFKQTPIVMVTGHTGLVDRAKAKLVRASGYLTKPFTQSDLLKMVFKHLT